MPKVQSGSLNLMLAPHLGHVSNFVGGSPVLPGFGKPLPARKNCALADQEIANGCTTDRTAKLKIETPVPSLSSGVYPSMRKSSELVALAVSLFPVAVAHAQAQPQIEFDHVWIMVSPNAPERAVLQRAGLQISPDINRHDGQGTASITVELQNAFLELMWPDSTVAVKSGLERAAEKFRQRMLWRSSGWCPIGIGFRRITTSDDAFPFPTWSITAPWLPAGSAIEMLTPREDMASPSLFVSPRALSDQGEQAARASRFRHAVGVHRITAVRLISPKTYQPIAPLSYLNRMHVLDVQQGEEWAVELTFDGGRKGQSRDLSPDLPLVIRY
jgi:hypothetical protein